MSTFAVAPGARLRFLSWSRLPEATVASPWEAVARTMVNDELPELAAVTFADPSAWGFARLTWTVPPPASGPESNEAVYGLVVVPPAEPAVITTPATTTTARNVPARTNERRLFPAPTLGIRTGPRRGRRPKRRSIITPLAPRRVPGALRKLPKKSRNSRKNQLSTL